MDITDFQSSTRLATTMPQTQLHQDKLEGCEALHVPFRPCGS